jgi:hypothetical protein
LRIESKDSKNQIGFLQDFKEEIVWGELGFFFRE